jgi:hypothetical protein
MKNVRWLVGTGLVMASIILTGCNNQPVNPVVSGQQVNNRQANTTTQPVNQNSTNGQTTTSATTAVNWSGDNVSYTSDGDEISGWNWLRDAQLKKSAQWTISGLPTNLPEVVINMEALATDQVSGGKGFQADFDLSYCDSTKTSGDSCHQIVHLPNVSPSNDPVGYTCQGQITIPGNAVSADGKLVLRATRIDSNGHHVAFNKGSIKDVTNPCTKCLATGTVR